MVGREPKRAAPTAAHEHGGDAPVAVAQPFGPQLAVMAAAAEGAEVLGPAAQVVAQADHDSDAQLAMNPCLRKACRSKLDLSSAMPDSTTAFWRCSASAGPWRGGGCTRGEAPNPRARRLRRRDLEATQLRRGGVGTGDGQVVQAAGAEGDRLGHAQDRGAHSVGLAHLQVVEVAVGFLGRPSLGHQPVMEERP